MDEQQKRLIDNIIDEATRKIFYEGQVESPKQYLIFAKHPSHAHMWASDKGLSRRTFNRSCRIVSHERDIMGRQGYIVVWLSNFWFTDAEKRYGLDGLQVILTLCKESNYGIIWEDPKTRERLMEYYTARVEYERKKAMEIDISGRRFD